MYIVFCHYSGYKYLTNEICEPIKIRLKINTSVNESNIIIHMVDTLKFASETIFKKIIICGGIDLDTKDCKNITFPMSYRGDKLCCSFTDYFDGIMTANVVGVDNNNDYVSLIAIYKKNMIEISSYCGDSFEGIREILPFFIILPHKDVLI
jgi:hypothetical protein